MNTIIKAVRRGFAFLILTLAAIGFMSAAASADMVDLARTGSVTIKFVSPETEKPITDSEFTIYEVAYLSQEKNSLLYTYTGDFYYCGIDLSGSLNQDLAEELAEYAEEIGAVGITKSIGPDGTATFDNLPLGLYLVVETKASYYYYSAGPFLVTLPLLQDAEWSYDVTASPKPLSRSEDEDTTEPTTEGEGGGDTETTTKDEDTETTTEGEKSETTTESSGGGGGGTIDPDPDDDDPGDSDDPGDDDDDTPSGGSTPSGGGGGGGDSYIIGDPDSASPQNHTPSSSSRSSSDRGTDTADDPDEANHTDEDGGSSQNIDVEPEDSGAQITANEEKLPQTGQANLPVPILALSGLGLFSAGWTLFFTDGRKKDAP